MTVTYTNAFEVDSSFVTGLYHDEDEGETYVVLNDSDVYVYESVPLSAVKSMANANSVGTYYNTHFKVAYGPSVDTFTYYPQDFVSTDSLLRGEDPTPTKEHWLGGVFDHSVSGSPIADASTKPTKEFSLGGPVANPLRVVNDDFLDAEVSDAIVRYSIFGNDSEFESSEVDVEAVLDEFNEVINRLNVPVDQVTISEVVFKFV